MQEVRKRIDDGYTNCRDEEDGAEQGVVVTPRGGPGEQTDPIDVEDDLDHNDSAYQPSEVQCGGRHHREAGIRERVPAEVLAFGEPFRCCSGHVVLRAET